MDQVIYSITSRDMTTKYVIGHSGASKIAIRMSSLREIMKNSKTHVAQSAYANWLTLNSVVRNHVHSVKVLFYHKACDSSSINFLLLLVAWKRCNARVSWHI